MVGMWWYRTKEFISFEAQPMYLAHTTHATTVSCGMVEEFLAENSATLVSGGSRGQRKASCLK